MLIPWIYKSNEKKDFQRTKGAKNKISIQRTNWKTSLLQYLYKMESMNSLCIYINDLMGLLGEPKN